MTVNDDSSSRNRTASGERAGTAPVVVMIASPLSAELVAQIQAVDTRLEVLYRPELLPSPRYPGDHKGEPSFRRNHEGQRLWGEMLSRAEVLFGIPGDTPAGLADAVRNGPALKWVQATAAGAGEQVRAAELNEEELRRVTVTTASGVHAGPLAEFAVFGLLAFAKDLPRLLADKTAHRWDRYPVEELANRTLLIVGLGAIGTAVAHLAKAFGMRTIGVNRQGRSDSPEIDEVRASADLAELLPDADAVVLSLPLTQETKGMLDATAIGTMRQGAVIVNVGRGGVVDEAALVDALGQGRLAGAALDVFATEPLPPDSPLWTLPNVIVSPHTAALSPAENARIVALFSDNLARYLRGDELLNRVETTLFY